MSRRSSVCATYQPCPGEAFVVEVVAADSYPDGLRQATNEAVRGVRELMVAAQIVWPHEVVEPAAEDVD